MQSITGSSPPSCPPMADAAIEFILRESAGLAWALRSHPDKIEVAQMLRSHNDAHPSWLSVLAACRQAGWPCTSLLDRLYAFHGRLAELIERDAIPDDEHAAVVRGLLDEHLCRLTREAVASLRAEAGAPSARG